VPTQFVPSIRDSETVTCPLLQPGREQGTDGVASSAARIRASLRRLASIRNVTFAFAASGQRSFRMCARDKDTDLSGMGVRHPL